METFRFATGKDIAELEININDMSKNGFRINGIVQQVHLDRPYLIVLMCKYTEEGKPV